MHLGGWSGGSIPHTHLPTKRACLHHRRKLPYSLSLSLIVPAISVALCPTVHLPHPFFLPSVPTHFCLFLNKPSTHLHFGMVRSGTYYRFSLPARSTHANFMYMLYISLSCLSPQLPTLPSVCLMLSLPPMPASSMPGLHCMPAIHCLCLPVFNMLPTACQLPHLPYHSLAFLYACIVPLLSLLCPMSHNLCHFMPAPLLPLPNPFPPQACPFSSPGTALLDAWHVPAACPYTAPAFSPLNLTLYLEPLQVVRLLCACPIARRGGGAFTLPGELLPSRRTAWPWWWTGRW